MKCILAFLLLSFIVISPILSNEELKRTKENGVEVILNPLNPLIINGTFFKILLQEEKSIDIEKFGKNKLVSVGSFVVDKSGNFYIYDNILKKVSMLDQNGNYISSFGESGQGPGEFQFVTRINILQSGEIVITDNFE